MHLPDKKIRIAEMALSFLPSGAVEDAVKDRLKLLRALELCEC